MKARHSKLEEIINDVYEISPEDERGVEKIIGLVTPIIKNSNIRVMSKLKIINNMKIFREENNVIGLQTYLTNSMLYKMGMGLH